MQIVVWEYFVSDGKRDEFQRVYSAGGAWTELFRKHPGYLGTELLHDANRPSRYVTIDRWTSEEAYRSFREDHRDEYASLDAQCEALTESETLIGYFILPETNA